MLPIYLFSIAIDSLLTFSIATEILINNVVCIIVCIKYEAEKHSSTDDFILRKSEEGFYFKIKFHN